MILVDTHCHIHSTEFFDEKSRDEAYKNAIKSEVEMMLAVGTSLDDSRAAIDFVREHPENLRAAVGIHPHEARKMRGQEIDRQLSELAKMAEEKDVVAIGECGFDFFYNKRSEDLDRQTDLLEGQLKIASDNNLPLSFHVRNGFDDFWPLLNKFPQARGVLHSFTDSTAHLERALQAGLFIGINGIATFSPDMEQIIRDLPLDKILLETDSPFLTPVPYRGTINEPKNVRVVAEFLAAQRHLTISSVAKTTTKNASLLFNL